MLPAPLFRKAAALARKLKVSRSRLIALALQDFSRRVQAREMLLDGLRLLTEPNEP